MELPTVATTPRQSAGPLQRRHFMKLLLGSGLVLGAGSWQPLAFAATRPAIGLQLYTVRELMQQDVRQTLQLLASLGYQEVEFAGLFEHPTTTIAKWLSELGLTAPAGHVLLKPMLTETNRVIDDALALGHRYLVMPYLFEHERNQGLHSYQQLAAKLNNLGELCNKAGLTLAYHNHDFEFVPIDNSTPYEVLLSQTDAALVKMEIDLYWAAKMQIDVSHLFRLYPGRFPLWHLKDMASDGSFADLGQGVIDFSPIVASADIAGLQHAFVERDVTNHLQGTLQQGVKGFHKIFG